MIYAKTPWVLMVELEFARLRWKALRRTRPGR